MDMVVMSADVMTDGNLKQHIAEVPPIKRIANVHTHKLIMGTPRRIINSVVDVLINRTQQKRAKQYTVFREKEHDGNYWVKRLHHRVTLGK
jgi:hypothetical protein